MERDVDSFFFFSIFISGGHYVEGREAVLATLIEGNPRKISVKLFKKSNHWPVKLFQKSNHWPMV